MFLSRLPSPKFQAIDEKATWQKRLKLVGSILKQDQMWNHKLIKLRRKHIQNLKDHKVIRLKSLCLSGPVKQNIFLLLGISIAKMQTQFTLRETQLSLSKVAKAHLF